jgi:hypothetical protein
MFFAYADPPYVGQAQRHYGAEAKEVNHAILLRTLQRDFDGWAYSLSSTSLIYLLRLQDADGYVVPQDTRIGAWVKPFASFKRGVDPAYAWEPVLFHTCRKWRRDQATCRDWISANITLKRGVSGAKPEVFNFWLFNLLGMTPSDEFVDVFPGSGAVSESFASWRAEP